MENIIPFIHNNVIHALLFLFGVWLCYICIYVFILLKNIKLLNRLTNIESLKESLGQFISVTKSYNDFEISRKFDEFNLDKKNEKEPLIKHLKNLFTAGSKSLSINIEEISSNTKQSILMHETYLKNILSVFIIIGLAGTLSYLSSAFSDINFTELASNLNTPNKINSQNLLGDKITNSFIPSLTGVIFTILGVLILIMIHMLSSAFVRKFNAINNNFWVPYLLPSNVNRVLLILETSERLLQENFESVSKVSKFAEDIENETETLKNTLLDTNSLLSKMNKLSTKFENTIVGFNEFSEKMGNTVNEMKNTQYETSKFYSTILEINENISAKYSQFNKILEQKVMTISEGVNIQNKILEKFENESFEKKKQIDDNLLSYISSNQKLNENTIIKYEDISKNFSEQNLNNIEVLKNHLLKSLEIITNSLDNLKNPLDHSSKTIESSLQSFDRRLEETIIEIKKILNTTKENPIGINNNNSVNDFGVLLKEINKNLIQISQDIKPKVNILVKLFKRENGQRN